MISRFLEAYQSGTDLLIYGDGKQSRDFIHVSDVARANWLALESDYRGALNIATGKAHTLLQVIEYMQAAGGKHADLLFDEARQGDIKHSYAAVNQAQHHIGFASAVSLSDGMKLLVNEAML